MSCVRVSRSLNCRAAKAPIAILISCGFDRRLRAADPIQLCDSRPNSIEFGPLPWARIALIHFVSLHSSRLCDRSELASADTAARVFVSFSSSSPPPPIGRGIKRAGEGGAGAGKRTR